MQVFLVDMSCLRVKPMQKTRSMYPSVVLTSMLPSIRVCHFLTMDLSLSVVKPMPWKLVKQFFPWTSSQINLEISQRNLIDTSLQTIRGNLGSSSSVDQGLANLTNFEDRGGLDIIPILPCEGVDNLLLGSFFATNFQALVFTHSHIASLVEVNQAILSLIKTRA